MSDKRTGFSARLRAIGHRGEQVASRRGRNGFGSPTRGGDGRTRSVGEPRWSLQAEQGDPSYPPGDGRGAWQWQQSGQREDTRFRRENAQHRGDARSQNRWAMHDGNAWSPREDRGRSAPSADTNEGRWTRDDREYWSPASHEGIANEPTARLRASRAGRQQWTGVEEQPTERLRASKVVRQRQGRFRFWRRGWWTPRRVVVVALVACLLIASSFAAVDGIVRASHIASEAADGIHHLRAIEALLQHPPASTAPTPSATPGSKTTPTPTPMPTATPKPTSGSATGSLGALLNASTLQQIKTELTAADADFSHLRADLAQPGGTVALAAHAPGLSNTFTSFAMLAAAADEGCRAGLDLVGIGQTALGILKGGMFAGSTKPAPGTPPAPQLDAKTYAAIQAAFQDASGHFDAAASYLGDVSLSAIPSQVLKASERTLLAKIIGQLPQARATLTEANAWLSVLGSLAGVGAPTSYLIELMDRSELRATGGFIGNYGVMTVSNGKIQPFDLSDVYLLDVPFSNSGGSVARPAAYPWWPFRQFGLRDSNVSANFPTSAQLGMQTLTIEGGQKVQGVIAITPTAIARAMTVVGNLQVVIPEAGINETVTPQNLEAKIHYYQQTIGLDPITGLPPSDQVSSPRKRFTALLGRAFMAKLHGLTTSQLSVLMQQMIESVHARDVQIFFANQNAEKLLAENGDDSSVAHGPGDSLTVVDDNVGANKGSQFNVITIADQVSVDANGVATHQLAVTYNFRVTDRNLLFGLDRYFTYLRIYAPPNAQLLHEDGFQNIFGDDQIGHSDVPGRQMWGGYVNVQDGVPYTLHLTWKVANVLVKDSSGNPQYDLLVQRQPGANVQLALTITGAGAKSTGVTDKHTMIDDAKYSVPFACLASPPCTHISASASGQSLVPSGAGSGTFGSALALFGSGVGAWLDRHRAA